MPCQSRCIAIVSVWRGFVPVGSYTQSVLVTAQASPPKECQTPSTPSRPPLD